MPPSSIKPIRAIQRKCVHADSDFAWLRFRDRHLNEAEDFGGCADVRELYDRCGFRHWLLPLRCVGVVAHRLFLGDVAVPQIAFNELERPFRRVSEPTPCSCREPNELTLLDAHGCTHVVCCYRAIEAHDLQIVERARPAAVTAPR